MRTPRILGEGRSFYHCMSRVVDRRFVFEDEQKEFFRRTMRKLEAFLGVRVVTYCLMSNHFHLLVEVPDKEELDPLTPESLFALLPKLYSPHQVKQLAEEWQRACDSGSEPWQREILDRFENRRGDLSTFLKELKQRFTQWYNRRNDRKGTLWEERFKSVLVEGSETPLLTMAAYIDLNPVRAGIVDSPEKYRWCGYGEAVAGVRIARAGLGRILEQSGMGMAEMAEKDDPHRATWKETTARYRLLLFDRGEERQGDETGIGARAGFSRTRVEAELQRGGELPLAQVLRCRVRYFCDGAVFGTSEFVESVFDRHRDWFGDRRRSGPRQMKGARWGDLRVLRELREEPIG